MRNKCLIFCCIIFQVVAVAQKLIFKDIELPQEMDISKMAQDANGHLWLCTNKGLFQYDGYDFRSPKLADESITAINTSKKDQILIGTQKGELYQLSPAQDMKPRLAATFRTPIKDIIHYPKGIVIATYGQGVYRLVNRTLIPIKTVSSKEIYDLELLDSNTIAIASDLGIDIVDIENELLFKNIHGLPDNIIVALCKHNNNLIAASYDSPLFSINLKNYNITIIDENKKKDKYLGLFCEGNKLIVHSASEIAEWHNGKKISLTRQQNDNKINACFVDDENNLWVVNSKYSMARTNLFYLIFAHFPSEEIQALAYFENKIYIGTTHGVIVTSLSNDQFRKTYLSQENITVLKVIKNKIYIGTYSNGFFVFDPINNQMKHYGKVEDIDDNTILDIEYIDDQYIEIATLAGIKSIDLESAKLNYNNVLIDLYCYDIFIDSQGRKWYGKDRNGLTVISKGITKDIMSFVQENDGKTYKLGSIYSIMENKGKLFFASASLGLVTFHQGKWAIIPSTHKANDAITSLVSISDHSMLIIRSSRFEIIDLDNMHILPYYNEKSGIQNELFFNNYCIASDDVYFGYGAQIMRFSSSTKVKKDPQVLLDKIEVNLEKVEEGKHVFAQDENNLRFTFIGTWLTEPRQIQYQYKLDGFDSEWRTTTDRIVSYPKLPPGNYIFKVVASENSTFNDEKPAKFTFEICTAYYNTWWFYLLLAASIFIFIYWLQKRKKSEALLKAELARKIIETELINLKNQLDPHFLFNTFNTLIGLIEEDPKRGIRFTEILTTFFRSLSIMGNKELVKLSEEMDLVNSYTEILKERFGGNVMIDINNNMHDIGYTFIPPMSIQMLIENAVKHNEVSKAKPLRISVYAENPYIVIRNFKNIKKTPAAISLGIGNNNIIERYRLLGRAIPYIENETDTYTFYLPIIVIEQDQSI